MTVVAKFKGIAGVIKAWEDNHVPDIDTWESEGGAVLVKEEYSPYGRHGTGLITREDADLLKTLGWAPEVKIPDYPKERTYTCPGCNKGVKATRIGNSCSYIIEHVQKNECKYKGPVKV